MKILALKLAKLALYWAGDVHKLASDYLFFLETGKTPQEAAREFLKDIHVVPAHEAKEAFLNQKKGGVN